MFVYANMLTKYEVEKINRAENLDMDILLMGGPNNTSDSTFHLDIIDASEGEPFTLEPFKKNMLDMRRAGKDYIIARVTTADPNNPSLMYNYYYSAIEINKLLFKYESDRHLLHRMRVRNPLNNMFILGQVYYYKIVPQDVDQGLYEHDNPVETAASRSSQKAFSAIVSVPDSAQNHDNTEPKARECSDVKTTSRDLFYKAEASEKEARPEARPGDSKRRAKIRARYFATDSDFLVKSQVREYFKQNVVNKEDYFIFELERTQNDFLALLDTPDSSEDGGEAETWKRALTAHLSFILIIICVLLFLGTTPVVFFVVLPLAAFALLSMGCSLTYVFCCRRRTFGTMDVNDVEEV